MITPDSDQRVLSATPRADGLSVRLVVDKLVFGRLHELHLPGLRDRTGPRLLPTGRTVNGSA